jgi:hypothetical protein
MTGDKKALFDAACERADEIIMFYRTFAEKKPVMLLEHRRRKYTPIPISNSRTP